MQAENESRSKVVLDRMKLNFILDGWISFPGSIRLTSLSRSVWFTSFCKSIWFTSFCKSIRSILFYVPARGHLMKLCATGIWPLLLFPQDSFRCWSSHCRDRFILKGADRTDDISLTAKERGSAIMMGCQHGASPFQELGYLG